MQRVLSYATGISANGTYCAVQGSSNPSLLPNVPSARGEILAVVTFQVVAGTGVSAGTVQPVVLGADGNYRAYGSAISLTAPGSNFVSLLSPVLGVAIQVTATITGGTAYLEVDAVVV